MIVVLDAPVVVETEISFNKEDYGLVEVSRDEFYGRLTIKEIKDEIRDYQLEQEEIARLEREKEERRKAKELEEKKRLERLEKERLASLIPTFNPYDVRVVSNISSEQFYQLLGNTGLVDVAWVFPYIEKEYGINALFLTGLVALESSWGSSERAVHHNNLTGYNIRSNSDIYKFETRADSIIATAKLIATHYLPSGAKYHNGVSVWGINEKYCAQSDWADKIVSIANGLLYDL